jgi:FkbM family methyltransferase
VQMRDFIENLISRAGLYSTARDMYQRCFNRPEWLRRIRLESFTNQFVKKGDLVFDVGANEGRYTGMYQRLGARVVAVEPNSELARRIRLRYRPFAIVDCAVGASEGSGMLHLGRHSGHSTLSREWMEAVEEKEGGASRWTGVETVQIRTLDHLIEAYGMPNVLKIDVEGLEAEVLSGLSAAIHFVYFEFHSAHIKPTEDSCRLLDNLGKYEFNYSAAQDHELRLHDWVDSKRLLVALHDFAENSAVSYGDIFARLLDAK